MFIFGKSGWRRCKNSLYKSCSFSLDLKLCRNKKLLRIYASGIILMNVSPGWWGWEKPRRWIFPATCALSVNLCSASKEAREDHKATAAGRTQSGESRRREPGLGWEAQTECSLVSLLLFSKPGSKDLEENSLSTGPREKQGQAKTVGSQTTLSPGDTKSYTFFPTSHTKKCRFLKKKKRPKTEVIDHQSPVSSSR